MTEKGFLAAEVTDITVDVVTGDIYKALQHYFHLYYTGDKKGKIVLRDLNGVKVTLEKAND